MIQNIIDNYIREERAKRDEERKDKEEAFYFSSIGYCQRRQYLTRLGVYPDMIDDRLRRVFAVGNIFEDWVVTILENKFERFELFVYFDTQGLITTEGWRGRYDMLLKDYEGFHLYEIKTKHSRFFHNNYEPDVHYEMQLAAYKEFIDKEITDCRILYISKDDLILKEVGVNTDKHRENVLETIVSLNKSWKEKKIPDCTCGKFCKWELNKKYRPDPDVCQMTEDELQEFISKNKK